MEKRIQVQRFAGIAGRGALTLLQQNTMLIEAKYNPGAIKIYTPLAIGNGVLSTLSVVLLSLAVKRIITHAFTEYSASKKKEIPENRSTLSDLLRLELGYELIPLVDREKEAELLEQIRSMRQQIYLELGIKIPKIRIMDNLSLSPLEYCIKIRGNDMGRGIVKDDASIITTHLEKIIKLYVSELIDDQE